MPFVIALCRIVIGLVFAWSFIGKIQSYSNFVHTIDRFKLLPKAFHRPTALAFLGGELVVLGAMILGGKFLLWGFLLATVMLTAFIFAMSSVLIRKIQTPCNCFGSSETPVSLSDIVRNIILVAFSLGGYSLLVTGGENLVQLGWLNWGLAGIVAGVFVLILVQLREIIELFG